MNPFGGKLTLLIEPRITGNAWWIFGDPATAPVLEFAYLTSAPGPQIASSDGWEVLGTEMRVVLDFGAVRPITEAHTVTPAPDYGRSYP